MIWLLLAMLYAVLIYETFRPYEPLFISCDLPGDYFKTEVCLVNRRAHRDAMPDIRG